MLKVRNLQDNTWQVYEYTEESENTFEDCPTIYQGNLSDCEAYIRLSGENRLY